MSERSDSADAADRAVNGMAAFADVGAAQVFGAPIEVSGRTLIPSAAFDFSVGFGFGGGGGDDGRGGAGGGSGGGAGGRTQGHPVAIIEVSPEGVRVRPVFDWTRLAVLALTTGVAVWRATRPARHRP